MDNRIRITLVNRKTASRTVYLQNARGDGTQRLRVHSERVFCCDLGPRYSTLFYFYCSLLIGRQVILARERMSEDNAPTVSFLMISSRGLTAW